MGEEPPRILIAFDGSEQAQDAVQYTGDMVRPGGGTVTLLHIFNKVPDAFWDLGHDPEWNQKVQLVRGWETQQRQKTRRALAEARQLLLTAGLAGDLVSFEMKDREEDLGRDICRETTAQRIDVVVVGRRGINIANDVVLGGVAEEVLGNVSGATVWLVGGRPDPRRVLVGLDASDGALAAVDHVGHVLRSSDCLITFIHVVRGVSIPRDVMKDSFPVEYRQRLLEEAENAIKPAFDSARTRLLDAGVAPERLTTTLITGVSSRAGAILEEARKGGYGTIVLGRHGLTRASEPGMGRVCRQVTQMVRNRAVWIVD